MKINDQASNDRAAQRAKADRDVGDRVLRSLVSNEEGRRWLWLQLSACQVFGQTLVLAPEGYAATAFSEGKRSVGLALLADLDRIDPRAYMVMSMEANNLKGQEDERSTDES